MIPSGWKRVGEPVVYWEIYEASSGNAWRFKSIADAKIAMGHTFAMADIGEARLVRITRRRLERTVVREKLIQHDGHGPDLEVGTWTWGRGNNESIGLYLELSGAWSLWMNGVMLDAHPTRDAAESTCRKLLRDAGYRVVRAKEAR